MLWVGSAAALGPQKLWFLDQLGDLVRERTLSTDNDISTSSESGLTLDVSSQTTTPFCMAASPSGHRLYVGTGFSSGTTVYQYNLSTPGVLTSATYQKSFDVSTGSTFTNLRGICLSPDGSVLLAVGNYPSDPSGRRVAKFTVSSAWEIDSASYSSISPLLPPSGGIFQGICARTDGTSLYAGVQQTTDTVRRYTMSPAWDVTSLTFADSVTVWSQDRDPAGVAISADGTVLLYSGYYTNGVYQYSLPTPFSLSGGSYASKMFSSGGIGPTSMWLEPR